MQAAVRNPREKLMYVVLLCSRIPCLRSVIPIRPSFLGGVLTSARWRMLLSRTSRVSAAVICRLRVIAILLTNLTPMCAATPEAASVCGRCTTPDITGQLSVDAPGGCQR